MSEETNPSEKPENESEESAADDQAQQPSTEDPQAKEAQNLEPDQMARFITTIKNAETQVGEHVLRALHHPDTVAVLTTVVVGPAGHQHIVSAALNAQKTAQVNALVAGATQEREEEEPCVGFHCLINPKKTIDQEGE